LCSRKEREHDGKRAVCEACLLRFRPIMVATSAATVRPRPLANIAAQRAEIRQPVALRLRAHSPSAHPDVFHELVVYIYLDRFRLPLRGPLVMRRARGGRLRRKRVLLGFAR